MLSLILLRSLHAFKESPREVATTRKEVLECELVDNLHGQKCVTVGEI